MSNEHVDVLVVGAGISGISAAHHLQTQCPEKSFLILEGRDSIGGTWDLFKYPGIRSDSDMYTLGFSFRPGVTRKPLPTGRPSCRICAARLKMTGCMTKSASAEKSSRRGGRRKSTMGINRSEHAESAGRNAHLRFRAYVHRLLQLRARPPTGISG